MAEKTSATTTPAFTISAEVTHQIQTMTLPLDGFSRASQLLPFLPIGESTLWKWCKDGRFPKPVKLSATITAWSNKEVHQWFNEKSINNNSLT